MLLFLNAGFTAGVTVTGANFTKLAGGKTEEKASAAARWMMQNKKEIQEKVRDLRKQFTTGLTTEEQTVLSRLETAEETYGPGFDETKFKSGSLGGDVTLAGAYDTLKGKRADFMSKLTDATKEVQEKRKDGNDAFEEGKKDNLWSDNEEMQDVVSKYATPGISGQVDLGYNFKVGQNTYLHVVGSVGKTFKQQSVVFKPGYFGQIAIEPTFMIAKSFGALLLVGLKITRNSYDLDTDDYKDIKSLKSAPLGCGIVYMISDNIRGHLKYFYNYTWGGEKLDKDKTYSSADEEKEAREKNQMYYAAQSYRSHNIAAGLTWLF
ncbi:MAG: hypothetical protein H6850_00755 [Alphaproteobacteria bacterium]|nr:MAG: hypothetical protein H6850_00755 [Alphaproteobacteria bacterium]